MSLLQVKNVTKEFPGVRALNDVCAEFESGKVNGLIGKNGSGKSTLIKIINGAQKMTSGHILLDGEELCFSTPKEAADKGIATVYQEMSLVPGMTVAENVWIGRVPTKGHFVDWKETYGRTQKLFDEIGIDISPKEYVMNLSVGQMQMIEIAKAMGTNPKVLLLDEPTSALAQQEIQHLFKMIRKLREKDVIIIYISHRLQELWEIADNCTILRDGMIAGRREMDSLDREDLLKMMFGNVTIQNIPKDLKAGDEVVLEVRNLSSKRKFEDVSFKLHRGEILGIAGMLGSGRTELLKTIFGADREDSGEILFEGKRVGKHNPLTMKNLGMAFTPEDRKREGLVQIHSVSANLCMASLHKISPTGFIDKRIQRQAIQKQFDDLSIVPANPDMIVAKLSGGNQQKVVVGNWLNTEPKIIMLDEPSRGIDVKAKQQIFEIIWKLSANGISCIVVSSELEELLEVCHRILIMRYGRIEGEVKPEDVTVEELYNLCMGG